MANAARMKMLTTEDRTTLSHHCQILNQIYMGHIRCRAGFVASRCGTVEIWNIHDQLSNGNQVKDVLRLRMPYLGHPVL